MRVLEVRRHSMRRKPGEHLSQDGIELARLVGEASEPFGLTECELLRVPEEYRLIEN